MAHTGTRALRLSNTNPSTYLLLDKPVPFQPGLKYRYRAWIKTWESKGDDSAHPLLEWSGAQGWIGGSYAEGKKGDQDWFLVEGVTGRSDQCDECRRGIVFAPGHDRHGMV